MFRLIAKCVIYLSPQSSSSSTEQPQCIVRLSVLFSPKRLESSLSEKSLGKAILYNIHVVKFLLMLKTLFLYIIQEEQNNFTAVRDKKYGLKDFSDYYKNFWRS